MYIKKRKMDSNKVDNLRVLMQLVNAMNDAVVKLEKGYEKEDLAYVEKAKKFILEAQKRVSIVLSKNG